MYNGRDEGQEGNFVSAMPPSQLVGPSCYHRKYAYFGIALRANLVSHFGISTSVARIKQDRKL